MSCTKIGRIRKLIKKLKAHGVTYEASKPHAPRTISSTITTRNKETGELIKTKTEVLIYDNTYGRTERRAKQLKTLELISKEHKNDGRFRVKKGGSGGKRKAKEPKEGKGKRKKK